MFAAHYGTGPEQGAPEKAGGKADHHNRKRGGYAAAGLIAAIALITLHFFSFKVIITPEGYFAGVTNRAEAAVTSPTAGIVDYPQALFNDGKAHHFQYKTADGLTIRYFIMKSSDGVIRAAFDACDVCWPAGKGYVQKGDNMVCRNCGRQFPSTKINVVTGGCNPSALNREIQGDKVVIQVKDIVEGRRYFDFKGARK